MKKSILLVRTSTYRQEIETQVQELTDFARQYTQDELIVIGQAGASAIKEDDMYQCQMREVERLIANGDIDCVYAWEISRIGRREETLAAFKAMMVRHKVQLRIFKPSLALLNPDGTVNDGMSIAFSLFANLAEAEMQNKKERFRRGKERNRREGRYNGGYISFGYRVDDDGYFVINEEEAEEVRQIFLEYISGNEGLDKMSRRTGRKCNALIKNKQYIGADGFPPIIDEELFRRAEKKRQECRNNPRDRQIYCDYTKGLVLCQEIVLDGGNAERKFHRMNIQRGSGLYEHRPTGTYIGINALDAVTLEVLDMMLSKCDFAAYERMKQQRRKELEGQIVKFQTELDDIDAKLDKLEEDYYVSGRVKHYEKYKAMLEAQKATVQSEKTTVMEELSRLSEKSAQKPDLYGMGDADRKETCRKYIQRIVVVSSVGARKELDYVFRDLPVDGCSVTFESKMKKFRFGSEPDQWRKIRKIEKEPPSKA